MTPQESQVLEKFLAQLTNAHLSAKDPEALAMISKAVAQQPDAAYLLVQRALLLEQALQQAKSQLSRLQGQRDDGGNSAWSQATPAAPGPVPASASTPQAQAAPQTAGPTGGWSGFLGNAASTAAGVAGGAFLFQGIEGLFGHHGGGFFGESAPTEMVENVTINDYTGNAESPRFDFADDADRGDRLDDADHSNFASVDDLDAGIDGDNGDDWDDFNDDSSGT